MVESILTMCDPAFGMYAQYMAIILLRSGAVFGIGRQSCILIWLVEAGTKTIQVKHFLSKSLWFEPVNESQGLIELDLISKFCSNCTLALLWSENFSL